MSLDPSRRRKHAVDIEASSPGTKAAPEIDDLKPPKRGVVGFFRKIFAK